MSGPVTSDRLAGRRLLITGASSGIGRAVAEHAAVAGARVALVARRAETLAEVAAGLAGDGHTTIACDLTDDGAARAAVRTAADALGGLDGVVNSAGIARAERILEGDAEGWRAMLEINVLSLLVVTTAAVPHLRAASEAGSVADVCNISSMSGRRRPNAELSVYSGTKHAVHVISDGLREELTPLGIRTSVISPGFVATPIFTASDATTAHSSEFDDRAHRLGLTVDVVAEQIVHTLAAPAGTMLIETAMLSTGQ